jgi:hypothetical protein
MKNLSSILSLSLLAVLSLTTCKKERDVTPTRDLTQGKNYTIAELKALATCTNSCQRRFTTDAYLTAIVAGDETSGNIFEELYVQDETGALRLELTDNSNFLVGDKIRVNLKGLDIGTNSQSNMIEIDSINYETQIVKTASGLAVTITDIGLNQINGSNFSQLVRISNVGFIPADTAELWSDPITKNSVNRTLKDCSGGTIIIRTSGYAKFAAQKTPKGNGTIIGIVTNYGSTKQFVVRDINEVNLNGSGCITYITKNFNDNSVTSGTWTSANVTNTNTAFAWGIANFTTTANSTPYGRISGFSGSAANTENWLISPPINLSSSSNPILEFQTAAKFSGPALEVKISTNYVSGAPSTATWTDLTATLSPNTSNYTWTYSGAISLSTYKNANVRIAFRYTSSTTGGATTYQLDDINVREN